MSSSKARTLSSDVHDFAERPERPVAGSVSANGADAGLVEGFASINRGYDSTFRVNRLTIGLVVPLESVPGAVPTMERHRERVRFAEDLGFASVWLRDVPMLVPSFGDAGQIYDPFVYLGYLAASTERIALGVASIVLPLRHPAHVAKAAASADHLSGGRLLLGVASGDRPQEYPALDVPYEDRAQLFRDAFAYIRSAAQEFPRFESSFGRFDGQLDLLPKPPAGRLPLLITGSSRQDPNWIARHGDGWMTYPRPLSSQIEVLRQWRGRVSKAGQPAKPVVQPLYVDLLEDDSASPQPIHLGLRLGPGQLSRYLHALREAGIHHVALNLRFNQRDVEKTLEALAEDVLPEFPSQPQSERPKST